MKFFIGSSKEARDCLDWLSKLIEELHHEAWRWDDPGMFSPGIPVLYRLIEISQSVDAAIFVFSDDDRTWYRGEEITQPRDNILIEYGMFAGQLGPPRAVICVKGSPRIATDVEGLTCIDISDGSLRSGRVEIVKWIQTESVEQVYRTHLSSIRVGSSLAYVCQQAGKCYRDLDELNRKGTPKELREFDHTLAFLIAGKVQAIRPNAIVSDLDQGQLASRITDQILMHVSNGDRRSEDQFKP